MSTSTDSYAIPSRHDTMDEIDSITPFESLRPRPRRVILEHRPSLAPTIAPLGVERRIAFASRVAAVRCEMIGPRSWLHAIAGIAQGEGDA